MNAPVERKASPLLIVGIVLLPIVFAWLTLRKGYSPLARGLAFGWLAFSCILVGISPSPPKTSGTTVPTAAAPAAAPSLNLSDPSVLRSLMVGKMWACGDGESRTYYVFRDGNAGMTFAAMDTTRRSNIFQMSAVVDGDEFEKGKVQIGSRDIVSTVNFMGQKNDYARGDGVTEYQGPFMVLSRNPDYVVTWHLTSYSSGSVTFTSKTHADLSLLGEEAQAISDNDVVDVKCSISDDPTFRPDSGQSTSTLATSTSTQASSQSDQAPAVATENDMSPAASRGDCTSLDATGNAKGVRIPGHLAIYEVVGAGRTQFYSAPNAGCIMPGVFVVPKDQLIAYVEYEGFLSVMYTNSKTGTDVQGWIRTSRVRGTGTGISPQ